MNFALIIKHKKDLIWNRYNLFREIILWKNGARATKAYLIARRNQVLSLNQLKKITFMSSAP